MDYYEKAPAKDKKAKARGVYDLREVEGLRKPDDPTAPPFCIEVVVEKHDFILDFGYKGARLPLPAAAT